MIRASSGSAAIWPANRDCSVWLYTTTGGQTPGGASEPTPAQPLNKIVPMTRAVCGRVQHLAVNGIGVLQIVQPLGSATRALARPEKVKKE
jgi:hypothetical protein